VTYRAQCVSISLLLHNKASTLASLLYKAEKPYVYVTVISAWIDLGLGLCIAKACEV